MVRQELREVRIVEGGGSGVPADQLLSNIACRIRDAPLPEFADQGPVVPSSQAQSSNRHMAGICHRCGHGTSRLTVDTRTEHYDAHAGTSRSRMRRCSSMRASAKNLQPQLMYRIG